MPHQQQTEIQRFKKYVEHQPGGCWVWRGSRQAQGYGIFMVGSKKDKTKKLILTHRYQYQRFFGPIPAGLCVLHKCDNPPCVNPEHLRLGTLRDNTLDALEKGRLKPPYKIVLTGDVVREIRRRRASGERCKDLATEFGVQPCTISDVVTGRSWKHID